MDHTIRDFIINFSFRNSPWQIQIIVMKQMSLRTPFICGNNRRFLTCFCEKIRLSILVSWVISSIKKRSLRKLSVLLYVGDAYFKMIHISDIYFTRNMCTTLNIALYTFLPLCKCIWLALFPIYTSHTRVCYYCAMNANENQQASHEPLCLPC